MKKIIIIIGIILIIAIIDSLILFIFNKFIGIYPSKYEILGKREDIYIEIIDGTITPTSLTYKIYNNTNEIITYGEDYEIECYKGNEWKEYGIEISWTNIGIILKANSNNEENIGWKDTYGKLAKGKYRIIKRVRNIILFDEFEIR